MILGGVGVSYERGTYVPELVSRTQRRKHTGVRLGQVQGYLAHQKQPPP